MMKCSFLYLFQVFTARKRRLGQGNVFTGVCLFTRGGGICLKGGLHLGGGCIGGSASMHLGRGLHGGSVSRGGGLHPGMRVCIGGGGGLGRSPEIENWLVHILSCQDLKYKALFVRLSDCSHFTPIH